MNGPQVVDSVVRTHQGSETARGSISELTVWRILVEKRGYVFKSAHSTSSEGTEFGLSIVEEMASTYGRESDSDKTDEALQRVRDTFEEAADEAEEMNEKAQQAVEDAIDNLENRIEQLRNHD